MKTITAVVATAVFFTTELVYGQAKPGPNYEHLKSMEWIIGDWVLETQLPEDVPGMGKKGDDMVVELSYQWGLKKNVITLRQTNRVKGKLVQSTRLMVGWDAEKKQVVGAGFDTDGGYGHGVLTFADDGFVVQSRTVSPEGKGGKATLTVKRIDDNTMTAQTTGVVVGGEEQPDQPVVEFKRKTQ